MLWSFEKEWILGYTIIATDAVVAMKRAKPNANIRLR